MVGAADVGCHEPERHVARGGLVEFLLAGDPDPGNPAAVPNAAIEEWVKEGVLDRICLVDEMPGLFADTDVVVLPSYRAGLPKGLIELAAGALSMVTTDVPGCREVATDGVVGQLLPVRDADALALANARWRSSRSWVWCQCRRR